MIKKSVVTLIAAGSVALLAMSLPGCGGGGGGGSSSSVPAAATCTNCFVDPAFGSDTTGDGSTGNPWKTLSHATSATAATAVNYVVTINAAPGLYSTASGETFPIVLHSNQHIVGSGTADVEGGTNVNVDVGELAGYIFPTTFLASSVTNVSLSNMFASQPASAPANTFLIAANAQVTVANNTVLNEDAAVDMYPFWAVSGAVATFTGNTITGWVAIDTADGPTKVIARNNHLMGAYTICTADFTPTASQLDLGTIASPGGNVILNNSASPSSGGVNDWGAAAGNGVSAVGNTWQPNVQGADGFGQYTTHGNVPGPTAPTAPFNYYVVPTAGIDL